jgi:uncharacterized membrane protein YozB (DUF420 family)
MLSVSDLPTLNAALNFSAAVLLGFGFYFIRQRRIQAHKRCMTAAMLVSVAFLTSYVIYHYHAGSVPFTGQGWIRLVYFFILITHVILAIVIVPMVLRTAYLGYAARFEKHVPIARKTFPLWMYVSVTGVVVYLMLYQL